MNKLFLCFVISIGIHVLLLAATHVIPSIARDPGVFPMEILRTFSPQNNIGYSQKELQRLAHEAFTQNPLPTYPPLALSLKQEGITHITVKILKDGGVEDILIKKTSGSPLLDQAVRDAVLNWNLPNPKKVETWLDLPPFHFQLKENSKTQRMSHTP